MTNTDTKIIKYRQMAQAILSTKTLEDAAFLIGCSVRSVQRALADERFRSVLHEMQSEMLQQTSLALSAATTSAVAILVEIMQDADNPPGVRARASELLLSSALKWNEQVALANRVKALETEHAKAITD